MWVLWLSLGICVGAALVIGVEIAVVYHLSLLRKRQKNAEEQRAKENGEKEEKEKDTVPPIPSKLLPPMTPEQKKRYANEWPEPLVKILRDALAIGHEEESCVWLNVIVARHFLELRRSEIFKNKLISKFQIKLRSKITSTELVHDILVRDLQFGDRPPRIRRAKLLPSEGDNPDLLVYVEFDLVYSGGLKVFLEVELAGSIFIPVVISLNGFAGKLRVRCPRPDNWLHFNISFASNPGFQFEIEWKVVYGLSEFSFLKDRLNAFIEKKLEAVFLDTWVLPSWRFFELPLLNYPSKHPFCRCNLGDLLKEAQNEPSRNLNDVFPLDVKASASNVAVLEAALTGKMQFLAKDSQPAWHTLKTKQGVTLQKMSSFLEPDIYRGSFVVNFDPLKVAKLLSNPDHLRLVDEGFIWATTIEPLSSTSSIRHCGYKLSKSGFDLYVLDAHRYIDGKNGAPASSVIARRSVQVVSAAEPAGVGETPFIRGLVHLAGYYIEPSIEDPQSSLVICVSQLGRGLEKLDFHWKKLNLLKQLLEKSLVAQIEKRERFAFSPSRKTRVKDDDEQSILDARDRSMSLPSQSSTEGELLDPRRLSFHEEDEESPYPTVDDETSVFQEDLAEEVIGQRGDKASGLHHFPEVTQKNYKDVSIELVARFLSLMTYDKEGDFAWRKVKEVNSVPVFRKKADDGPPVDIVKASIELDLPPATVFESLLSERYYHLLHPDFLSCEQLEIFDQQHAIVSYSYKSTFLSDRDAVVLEVSHRLELPAPAPESWIVVQQSVDHPWVGKSSNKDQAPTRCDVFLAGYLLEAIPGKESGTFRTRLTHISQIDGKFPVGVGSPFRYGWAKNLHRFKTFVDKNPLLNQGGSQSFPKASLPMQQLTEGLMTVSIKPGDVFAWTALSEAKSGSAQLEWDFDTQSKDIRWGIFFQPLPENQLKSQQQQPSTPSSPSPSSPSSSSSQQPIEEVIIPYARYKSHLRPANGKVLLAPKQGKGRYIMRWDNRYSTFNSKSLRFQVALNYLSESIPTEEINRQHISGEVQIEPYEIFKIPFLISEKSNSKGTLPFSGHLVWDFKLTNGSEISFRVIFQPSKKKEKEGENEASNDTLLPSTVIVPATKIRGTETSIRGGIPIGGNPGRYILIWDNSASKWSSKNMIYTISVVPELSGVGNGNDEKESPVVGAEPLDELPKH